MFHRPAMASRVFHCSQVGPHLAKEEENCVRMTSRTANFGSTDIRFKKKNMEAPKKTKKQENAGFCEACLELCFLAGLALPRPANQ